MSDNDEDKLPEEVWAAEIAQDEYDGEEIVVKNNKKSSIKLNIKPIKETNIVQTSPEEASPEEASPEEASPEETSPEESSEEQIPQQPNEEIAETDPDQFKQAPEQGEVIAQPQENIEELGQLYNEFEIELQNLDQFALQPIDEVELGFPQSKHYKPLPKNTVIDEEDEEMSVKNPLEWVPEIEMADEEAELPQPLPPLPILFPQQQQEEKEIPPKLYPLYLRHGFEEMTEKRQKRFLQQMRELFPDLFPIEDGIDLNELQGVIVKNPNELDDDDDDEDWEDNVKAEEPPPPLPILQPIEEVEAKDNEWIIDAPFPEVMLDEECKKEEAYIARRWKEEFEEYMERLRREVHKKKKSKTAVFATEALKRGLQKHNELSELRKLRKLLDGTPVEVLTKPKDFYGTTDFGVTNADVLVQLFNQITFPGLIVLLHCIPLLKPVMDLVFDRQIYLWFSNEERSTKRFLPIDVCCERCGHKIDSESVTRVTNSFHLIGIIDDYLSMAKNLKCLRIFRFELNLVSIVRKLWENCPNVQHLDLTECYGLQLNVMVELCRGFPLMSHLILCSTNLSEEMLSTLLDHLQELITLNVSSTLIEGNSLKKMPLKLKRLDIRCCPNISAENMFDFIKSVQAKNLEHLKIDAFVKWEVYEKLFSRFRSIIGLQIYNSNDIVLNGNDFLRRIAYLPKLETLEVGRKITINEHAMWQIFQTCKRFRSLSFDFSENGHRGLTDLYLANLSHQCPNLESLEIMTTPIIESHFCSSLVLFKCLRYLNLSHCTRLTDEFFAPIITQTVITFFVLDKCHNLGKATLNQIIVRANQAYNEIISASMLSCDFRNLPYLKSKLLPDNLRLTYSSLNSKKYFTFDGKRRKSGRMSQIIKIIT